MVLGNTLTTDAKDTGTQALGSVHKEEEEDMNIDDRNFILDILNYDMKPIFLSLGFNVEGGEFVYAKKEKTDPKQQLEIVQGLKNMGLPMDDDWLYETFGVEKPANYDRLKAEAEERREAMRQQLQGGQNTPNNQSTQTTQNDDKTPFKDRLKSFFGIAPHSAGADTDF